MFVVFLLIIWINKLYTINIEQIPDHFKIHENSPSGTVIGTLQVYTSMYVINFIDNADGWFDLNPTGELITTNESRLNYEERSEFRLCIQFINATDIIEKDIIIHIQDINEPPYNFHCHNLTGICTVFDDDFNQTLKFEIIINKDSNNETFYEILCTDNGEPPLSVSTSIQALPDDNILTFLPIFLSIMPTDNDDTRIMYQQTRDKIAKLYINHGNNSERQRQRREINLPPQDIYFDVFPLSVPENVVDFEISGVYVVDENKDNYVCSVTTFNISKNQRPFEIIDNKLRTASRTDSNNYDIDYETTPLFYVSISCHDPIHHYSISKNATIHVIDVNEPPVGLVLTPNILPENSPVGYVIGRFTAIGPDISSSNKTYRYSIVMNPHNLFRIDDDKLVLARENYVERCIQQPELCPHDFEQLTALAILVLVEDNGEPPLAQRFWIELNITDQNDPPINLQLDKSSVLENSPVGTLVGILSAQDEDHNQTHTFKIINENSVVTNGIILTIEDRDLRILKSPDYEQEDFILITVVVTDNGTPPKSVTGDFLIEIIDVDELPQTYAFISNANSSQLNSTVNDLINRKDPARTFYLPHNDHLRSSIGQIMFIMGDRKRKLTLRCVDNNSVSELSFSEPICDILTKKPYQLLCKSLVSVTNPLFINTDNDRDGHLITTSLRLTSNNVTMIFSQPLRLKFENITLLIDNQNIESIYITKEKSAALKLGTMNAIDLLSNERKIMQATFSTNNILSYPVEIVNSTILKVRDDVDFSSFNSSKVYNANIVIIRTDEENRTIEKYLTINVQDKNDFNFSLSNNKVMENSHENTLVGKFIIEKYIGNYSLNLVDNANGRFALNGTDLITAAKYLEHCHINRTCPLDYETEPVINISIAVNYDLTNEIVRIVKISIALLDENEAPFNLTLSNDTLPETTPVGGTVAIIHAIDVDFNQTLNYTTESRIFDISNDRLILKQKVFYGQLDSIAVVIRAIDNGKPPEFIEQEFIINVTTNNQPPVSVTSNSTIIYISSQLPNLKLRPLIVAQLQITDPDADEKFIVTFDKPNYYLASTPVNSYSVIADDGFSQQAEIYIASIADADPPIKLNQTDYFVNVTVNITDAGAHSIQHKFNIHYVYVSTLSETSVTTTSQSTTTTESFAQVPHVNIYETTPPYAPIIRGLLRIALTKDSTPLSPPCTAIDDGGIPFMTDATYANQSTFTVYLPDKYILNATTRPSFLVKIQCSAVNDMILNEDIVVDVLPAPPPIKIEFNQTTTFYATKTINNKTILGIFNLVELTTIPTNRTYDLSMINQKDTFQLLPNGDLIQIGQYSNDILQSDNPYVNLTVQALETTPNQPVRLIIATFIVPVVVDLLTSTSSFSQSFVFSTTNPETTIENFSTNTVSTPYRLQSLNTNNDTTELTTSESILTSQNSFTTFSPETTQTQLNSTVALISTVNETIPIENSTLKITDPPVVDPCLNKDCGHGVCVSANETFSLCLCSIGYMGMDCRNFNSCVLEPCMNNGSCYQLSTDGNFSCQCLPNYAGLFCEVLIDVCQRNTSICPPTQICIPAAIDDRNTSFVCVTRDGVQYFVFDYLHEKHSIDAVRDKTFPQRLEDFIRNNIRFADNASLSESRSFGNIILIEPRLLGPEIYDRAQLIGVAVQATDDYYLDLNSALESFCANLSSTMDQFALDICSGYYQTVYLNSYLKSSPDFCPNCSFADAVDKFYWFDKVAPFFPFWLAAIAGALLLAVIPLIPFTLNAPRKVTITLMKARKGPEDEEEEQQQQNQIFTSLIKSVRSVAKFSHDSYRESHDSGYESDEDIDNYCEQIITNYQREYDVYPVLHRPHLLSNERRDTTLDDLVSQSNNQLSRSPNLSVDSHTQVRRSASMSPKYGSRRSSITTNPPIKPIIRHRPTLFDSSIGGLLRTSSTPRLNMNDDTYVSARFRNENTSKFVIGTLWNTFALINNMFLQRPRTRRNAITGDADLQADQLARLRHLYSMATDDSTNEPVTTNLESIFNEILAELKAKKTNNLQSIMSDMSSLTNRQNCKCYENHHLPTCIYYDHSLPYIRHVDDKTEKLEKSSHDIKNSVRPKRQDVTIESCMEKPHRTFTHFKPTTDSTTQSSPTLMSPSRNYCHAHTQYSPNDRANYMAVGLDLNKIEQKNRIYENIDQSTQTITEQKPILNDSSTQFSPALSLDNKNDSHLLNYIRSTGNLMNDHIYTHVSTQFSPVSVEHASIQCTSEEVDNFQSNRKQPINRSNIRLTKDTSTSTIHSQKTLLMNELKQVFSSSSIKEEMSAEDGSNLKSPPPSQIVRNLVSMFETTSAPNKSHLVASQKSYLKSSTNRPSIRSPTSSSMPIQMNAEEIHPSGIPITIEHYANEMATNIIDDAVLAATTTTIYHDEQQQQPRFSTYFNGGGHGKSLLFQTNTFVPSKGALNQDINQDLRAESAASSTLLPDAFMLTMPLNTENESPQTLIMGRFIDGDESYNKKPKSRRSLTVDRQYMFSSSSSLSSLNDERHDRQQYLSSSQLFSAQKLYIRPWLVRRATEPDIVCLDSTVNCVHDSSSIPLSRMTTTKDAYFNIFPSYYYLDIPTRHACLITILLYLNDVGDENSNAIVYDELDQIESQFRRKDTVAQAMNSNVFETVNPNGSKRYRTGFVLDVNSTESSQSTKVVAEQIEWKRVKLVIRRFRKKYQRHKQLIRNDEKKRSDPSNIDDHLKYFDSTSKRRMKKYAKHYAEKL